jgi:arsenate reductase (thioredoxin)
MTDTGKARVLFICTGNSARSQMAEAFLRRLGGDRFEAYSAGVTPKPIHPMVYQVMGELGYDLAGHAPKDVRAFVGRDDLDYAITVCDRAAKSCPHFPGEVELLHWSVEDPSAFEGSVQAHLAKFREVRDDLLARIGAFIAEHPAN